jgi:magnesium-transporting ATPase (P-type)
MATLTSTSSHVAAADSYWSQTPDTLMSRLGGAQQGLSSQTARQRLADVGLNTLETKAQVTALGLFLNQF